jgi:hypothetical protein
LISLDSGTDRKTSTDIPEPWMKLALFFAIVLDRQDPVNLEGKVLAQMVYAFIKKIPDYWGRRVRRVRTKVKGWSIDVVC